MGVLRPGRRAATTSEPSRNSWGPRIVQTTMIYTKVLNRGRRGVPAPSTVCGKPSPARLAGLPELTGRPKTGRKVVGHGRSCYNQSGCRPGAPLAFRLRPTRTGFIQVSQNRSSGDASRRPNNPAAVAGGSGREARPEPAAAPDSRSRTSFARGRW